MLLFLLPILLLSPFIAATPFHHGHHHDFPPYQSALPTDKRSPCPGLNTLANHGLIARDGLNVSLADVIAGAAQLNIGSDFIKIAFDAALVYYNTSTIDLDQLDRHNAPSEHDGSLTRGDFHGGVNNYAFNQTLFDGFISFFDGSNTTNLTAVGKARWAGVSLKAVSDSSMVYTANTAIASLGESALYSSLMGNPLTGLAPVAFVKILFEEERLPYAEGWRPSLMEMNSTTLGAMGAQIAAAYNTTLEEAALITAHTPTSK